MKTNRRRCSSQQKPLTRPETLRAIPAWQRERAHRLHRKFTRVEQAMQRGQSLDKALYQFHWFWRGQRYRSDHTKRVRFSMAGLRRLFYHWKSNGRTPDALRLNYRGLPPSVPAPVLCRFVDFSAALQFPHMKTAWREFARRKGAFGRGRRGSKPVVVTYRQLQSLFSGKKFAALQSGQRAIARAENHLAELRWQYTAEIQQRLPARPRRRRSSQTVSLDSSAL
jgi:hypothetical protein